MTSPISTSRAASRVPTTWASSSARQLSRTLVRTLGHESVHVQQYQAGRVSSMTGPLEDEAYAAEDAFVERWGEEYPMSTQLTVQRTFKLSGRPYLLVVGTLEGGPLPIGDHVTIQTGGRTAAETEIRSIEVHSAPGTTTIAVDVDLAEQIEPGTVVVGQN